MRVLTMDRTTRPFPGRVPCSLRVEEYIMYQYAAYLVACKHLEPAVPPAHGSTQPVGIRVGAEYEICPRFVGEIKGEREGVGILRDWEL